MEAAVQVEFEDNLEFEQCPLCESYNICEAGEDYKCVRCGTDWTADLEGKE